MIHIDGVYQCDCNMPPAEPTEKGLLVIQGNVAEEVDTPQRVVFQHPPGARWTMGIRMMPATRALDYLRAICVAY